MDGNAILRELAEKMYVDPMEAEIRSAALYNLYKARCAALARNQFEKYVERGVSVFDQRLYLQTPLQKQLSDRYGLSGSRHHSREKYQRAPQEAEEQPAMAPAPSASHGKTQ